MAFWRHYYHLVWATKGREPLIGPEIEARLYAYLVSKAAELGVYVYAINGWSDHIHLVVAIPPRLSVAEVVKHLKGASAHFVNHGLALDVKFGCNAATDRLRWERSSAPSQKHTYRTRKNTTPRRRRMVGWNTARHWTRDRRKPA